MESLEQLLKNTGLRIETSNERTYLVSMRDWYKDNLILDFNSYDYSAVVGGYIGFPNCRMEDSRLYAINDIVADEVLKIRA